MNGYLVVAYGFVWAIFTFYAWVIGARQQKLEKELEDLRRALGAK
jgi:CcmD family protein